MPLVREKKGKRRAQRKRKGKTAKSGLSTRPKAKTRYSARENFEDSARSGNVLEKGVWGVARTGAGKAPIAIAKMRAAK